MNAEMPAPGIEGKEILRKGDPKSSSEKRRLVTSDSSKKLPEFALKLKKELIYASKNVRLRFFEEAIEPSSSDKRMLFLDLEDVDQDTIRKAESHDSLSRLHIQDVVSIMYYATCKTKNQQRTTRNTNIYHLKILVG